MKPNASASWLRGVAALTPLLFFGCSSSGATISLPDASMDTGPIMHADAGTDATHPDSGKDATPAKDATPTQDATPAKDATGITCTAAQKVCDGACATVASDPDNCGTCGNACTAGQVCSLGACALTCAGGTTKCGQSCVEVANDPSNCGTCGTTCSGGQVCSGGTCGVSCAGGESLCTPKAGDAGADAATPAPYCANEQTDNANCGACGVACGAGQSCANGVCSANCGSGSMRCTPDGGAPYCANEQSDSSNCGSCGTVCGAQEACVAGKCTSTCVMSQTLCTPAGAPAYCADEETDNQNCGSCGNTCGAGLVCSGSACVVSCASGQTACPTANPTFCTETTTDTQNCGACGTACPGGQQCIASACGCPGSTPNACGAGATGFCTSFQTDTSNCGSCGTTCAADQVCANGVCSLTCGALTSCPAAGGNPAYCADEATDPSNCGGCGTVCALAHSTDFCAAHTCGIAACTAGWSNCDGNAANGCEANLQTSASNCGACGNACNAGISCFAGQCGPDTAGYPVSLAGTSFNSFGAATFDGSGNLLLIIGGPPYSIYSVSAKTDAVTTYNPQLPSAEFVSLAYQASNNTVYIGSGGGGQIYAFNLTTQAAATVVTTLSGFSSINSLAFAPAAFGAFGGQLCASGYGSTLTCLNLSTNVATTVATLTGSGTYSGMAFQSTGVAYVSDFNAATIYKVLPGGTSSTFATLAGGQVDGLAIDESKGFLYMANSGNQELQYASLLTGTVTNLVAADFDGGYWPSPIAYEDGSIFYAVDPTGPTAFKTIAAP